MKNKPKIFILLGSIRDPLYFFFLRYYPQIQQSKCWGKVTRNTLGGSREGSRESEPQISTHFSQGLRLESLGCTFCHWCRKNVPRNGQRPFARDKATQTAAFLLRWVESLLRDCSACKAPRGREDGEYQKIVVSYLVFIPLLASCPGSTIHGRLARVFCSDGSICFKTERLMPVIRYLPGVARMHPNAAWKPALGSGRTSGCWGVRVICLFF